MNIEVSESNEKVRGDRMSYFCKCIVKSVNKNENQQLQVKLSGVQGWILEVDDTKKNVFVKDEENISSAKLLLSTQTFDVENYLEPMVIASYQSQKMVKVTLDLECQPPKVTAWECL